MARQKLSSELLDLMDRSRLTFAQADRHSENKCEELAEGFFGLARRFRSGAKRKPRQARKAPRSAR